ncbi:helix-turn-helix transcriptional regulator [Streptomyces sp. McG3]|uniref:helix-turn-helix domain-containing protein n=1 Tax=Streptomyces sp. McG3 TaxID=2725483 RepID=UPI001BE51385|nr:helix-turn-helix transcriptional regulator [Streptomyces sp. McG3]MBT2900385.1 helix-turn-helix domain-containing protein [Streptomyces sp. McG3]
MTHNPARDAERPFAHLAEHLTALRHTARLPQRAVAHAANISRSAVQRAESGTAAPTPAVLDAYVRACGASPADQDKARRLYALGRTAQRGKPRALQAPAPNLVRDARDFSLVLVETYERAGAPPLRDFDRPGRARVPLATAWRIVNRKALPASREQLITFFTVCGIHPAAQRPYLDAYQHVTAQRGTRPAPPRRQLTQLIRRSHPVPLAYGGPDIGIHYDFDRLAAGIRPAIEGLAAHRARYDVDRLAAGIRPAIEALAADPGIRNAPTVMAAGVQVLADAFAVMYRSASREAHRNGTTPPDTPVIARTTDDHGIDLITHTPDAGTVLYQIKTHQQRPGPPPALTGARVPEPPPPKADARVA